MITGYEGDARRGRGTPGRGRRRSWTASGAPISARSPDGPGSEGRFRAPYLRDSMLDVGVLVETLETATWWSNLNRLYADVKAALEQTLGEGTIVLCHISHVYETGCSLYFTVAAKETDDPLAQWGAAKTAAGEAIAAAGATITHHHAVGTDHKPSYAGTRSATWAWRSCEPSRPKTTRPGSSTPESSFHDRRTSPSSSTRPPAAVPHPRPSYRWPGCCATPAPGSR